ncbi:MAG: hypothetical protein Q8L13_20575 [Bradyrhizobium sp.]|nr:hypothetical protein [Bradyrhizobium sp.]
MNTTARAEQTESSEALYELDEGIAPVSICARRDLSGPCPPSLSATPAAVQEAGHAGKHQGRHGKARAEIREPLNAHSIA